MILITRLGDDSVYQPKQGSEDRRREGVLRVVLRGIFCASDNVPIMSRTNKHNLIHFLRLSISLSTAPFAAVVNRGVMESTLVFSAKDQNSIRADRGRLRLGEMDFRCVFEAGFCFDEHRVCLPGWKPKKII